MTTNRHLTCCVCSAAAGRWAQHWNRDTGWGICPPCVVEQAAQRSAEDMAHSYGQPGVNYEDPAADAITIYYTDRANGAHAAKAPP